MRTKKNIALLLFKYQVRTLGFLTPLALIPALLIYSVYHTNIILLPFLFISKPFLYPQMHYSIPELFTRYFDQYGLVINMILGISTALWFNLYYFFTTAIIKSLQQLHYSQNTLQFEAILLSSLLFGGLLNFYLLKLKDRDWQTAIVTRIIFGTCISATYFLTN